MSRAFVKDSDDAGDALPEIPLSEHPNYVTPRGLAQLRARLDAAQSRRDALKTGEPTLAQQSELALQTGYVGLWKKASCLRAAIALRFR